MPLMIEKVFSMTKNNVCVALVAMFLAWLPYVLLQSYWLHLLRTIPGAAHNEISGPVLYFLPKLLAAAVLATLAITAIIMIRHRERAK